jgi:hemolysin activation/secretion protein
MEGCRFQVIEGSITEVDLRGAGAEQCPTDFNPVLSEHPSRLATLERQLLLINNLPGVGITDTSLEEI